MALLKLLQIRCICRIYCLFNCPQVNQPEAKFSCSFQELNLSLLEFEVDVKREHSLCLPLRKGAERSEAEGGHKTQKNRLTAVLCRQRQSAADFRKFLYEGLLESEGYVSPEAMVF